MFFRKNSIVLVLLLLSLSLIIGILSSYYNQLFLVTSAGFVLGLLTMAFLFKMTQKTLSILSVSLLISLFLIPSFSFGNIGLRVDDFIVIFISLALFFVFLKYKNFKMSAILKWLFVYLTYSFIISAVYILSGELKPIYMLFFIKEIQYFVYFLVFYYLALNKNGFSYTVRKTMLFVSLLTIGWGTYQLITGKIVGYYGIGIISVSAPSQSGVVLMLMSIFLLYMSLTTKKKSNSLFLTLTMFLSIAMTFATISRTAILILCLLLALYVTISMFNRWNIKKVLIAVYIAALMIPLSYFLVDKLVMSVLERFSRFAEGANGRIGFWKGFLSHSDLLGYIFGNGKGFMQVIVGTFTLKADSQYIRLVLEVGIIGLILWTILIGSILIFSLKNLKNNYYDSLFLLIMTIGFILIGVTQEGYLVAIQGSLYWILTGFFIGKISRQNEDRTNKEVSILTSQ
ncbi:O-antigen ligase family protein [Bacillus infantis]|nr:O-antigen ligase family protein [Bacillus infantis]